MHRVSTPAAPAQTESASATTTASSSASQEKLDRFGMFASGLCAVHCVVVALLPGVLSAMGAGALLGHEAEWVFVAVAIAFAGAAFYFGFRRHRSMKVAGLFIAGMLGLLASRAIEMSGEHHDEHGEHLIAHASAAEGHDEHDAHAGEHEGEEHHDDGAAHLVGTGVGVLAGLFLLAGHVVNIRETRCCDDEACA